MKSLQAFWRWFEGEKPAPRTALGMRKNLSAIGCESLHRAAQLLQERSSAVRTDDENAVMNGLGLHPEALRDLSLSLCAALERMHEQVPEPEKSPMRKLIGRRSGMMSGMMREHNRLLAAIRVALQQLEVSD